jgi:hypothetical protein
MTWVVQFTWRKRDERGNRYRSRHGPFQESEIAEEHARKMRLAHGTYARIEVERERERKGRGDVRGRG